jgi:signal transduction histidine kinase
VLQRDDIERADIERPDAEERLHAFIHDIRQYVATGLLLYDDDDLPHEELRHRLRMGERLFRNLSAFLDRESAGAAPELGTVDLAELVEECLSIFRHGHPMLRIRTRVDEGLVAHGDREGLHRALTNVLENSARAAGPHGHVTVQAWGQEAHAYIQVADDGRGFGQITRQTGRGMQTVDEVVRAARGSLEITSGPEAGTQVRLVLPRVLLEDLS